MNRFLMEASAPKSFTGEALSRSSFVATNPTPGTGIASLAGSTSRSATVAMMNIFNGANTDGTESYVIRPVWLKLTAGTANSSATDATLDFYMDSANRWASGGSAITEVALIDSAEPDFEDPTSKAIIHFGLLTLAAATDETLVASKRIATAVMALDDVFEVYWAGGGGGGGRDGTVMRGPGSFEVPPIWIRPGANLSIHQYGTAQAADPEFEFEFFYIESPNANAST